MEIDNGRKLGLIKEVLRKNPETSNRRRSIEPNLVKSKMEESAALPTSSVLATLAEVRNEAKTDAAFRRMSEIDRILLESLDIGRSRPRPTGRFLTMHKRRRKRLTTRSLTEEPELIFHLMFNGIKVHLAVYPLKFQLVPSFKITLIIEVLVVAPALLLANCDQVTASYICNTQQAVFVKRYIKKIYSQTRNVCRRNFRIYAGKICNKLPGSTKRTSLKLAASCLRALRQQKTFAAGTMRSSFSLVWASTTLQPGRAFIEEGYHSTNPYHNSIHATDVTQAMHCFLQEEKIRTHLTNLEIMASLIAAVTHDLDHPGVNQPFLVATSNHLAALYQNTSVLENHHWRSAIGCLLESGVSDQLPTNVRPELQRHISSLILATDITRQQEFLIRFKHYLDENLLEMRRADDRHFILQIALKCADISNPCRPWDISQKWSHKVCEEFFRQGDYERRLNLPVTPLCDRHTTSIPKIQAGFFKFVVSPLYEEWHRFLGDGLSVSLMEHLRANQKKWETLILQETAKETETEISELEEVEDAVSSVENPTAEEDTENIGLLIPAAYVQSSKMQSLPARVGLEHVGRRHSVPLSIMKPLTLLPRSNVRRESLPSEQSKSRNLLWKLDDQSFLDPSSLSLLSSKTSIPELSPSANNTGERPVSAESLLPETSIASITNSTEATRLSTVLQSDAQKPSTQTKQLTRQQTFPPLQPYVRTRYLSTTAEMSQCYSQILIEAETSASSSCSVKEKSCSDGRCGTPPTKEIDSSNVQLSKDIDILNKRRASAISETFRQKTEPSAVEYPRRHSVQTIRIEDFSFKNRYKRPTSAQGTDSTYIFYAPLTGSHSDKDGHSIEEESKLDITSISKTKLESEKSISEEQWTTTVALLKKSEQCSSITVATKPKCTNSELRRYSTPVPETKTITTDTGGRRFTAIPVSSELSTHKVFFIGSPPDSPPFVQSVSSSSDSGSDSRRGDMNNEIVSTSNKRDSDPMKERNSKVAKLSMDMQMKENVDPRAIEDTKGIVLSRKGSQSWTRRRGSAPVALLSRLDDIAVPSITTRVDHTSRRGSVPSDITRQQGGGFNRLALGPREGNVVAPRRASLPQETALGNFLGNILSLTNERENLPINNNNNNNNNTGSSNNNGIIRIVDSIGMPSPRRGSVPADISELRRDMFNRSSINGKPRNRKKILRRRSSGGPEMFSGGSTDGNDNGTWLKWKRELGRRGSLPIEMVAISHAGRYNHR
ncbi:cAMP-specific 3',5'-cyclic phosphodiesterase 7B [Melipona quadrifasciata]|uniref:Phosphodiesterase n=1 Tax=Melipona quadrifasciata TaxID=166423 RepID=A0A0N0BK76_9HYME|nr:cAMP-specific 3',5'-cyclic phosphodiesterase 7B [Melipona quadrifasciata]